jgi:hypothetical protein
VVDQDAELAVAQLPVPLPGAFLLPPVQVQQVDLVVPVKVSF